MSRLQKFLGLNDREYAEYCEKIVGEQVGDSKLASLPRLFLRGLKQAIRSKIKPTATHIIIGRDNNVSPLAKFLLDQRADCTSIQALNYLDVGSNHIRSRLHALAGLLYLSLAAVVTTDQRERKLWAVSINSWVNAVRLAQDIPQQSTVVFWGFLYSPDYYLMATRAGDTTVIAYQADNYLAARSFFPADEYWCTNPWQAVQIQKRRANANCIVVGNELTLTIQTKKPVESDPGYIAVYTSGMWVRSSFAFHSQQFIQKLKTLEESMLRSLREYCLAHQYQARIYLHPIERALDHADVQNYYNELTDGQHWFNLMLDDESSDWYGREDFGIGVLSTTLFERLEVGHRVIFAMPANLAHEVGLQGSQLTSIFWDAAGTDSNDRLHELLNLDSQSYINRIRPSSTQHQHYVIPTSWAQFQTPTAD